jgi:hypothetical protein
MMELSGHRDNGFMPNGFSKESAASLLAHTFDKDAITRKRLQYEKLDQLTMDLLLGVREQDVALSGAFDSRHKSYG